MKTFQSLQEFAALVGQEVAVSDWLTITQEQVNLFAQATGDHQWIHVDVARAKAGPFVKRMEDLVNKEPSEKQERRRR